MIAKAFFLLLLLLSKMIHSVASDLSICDTSVICDDFFHSDGKYREIEMAVAYDSSFCSMFGGEEEATKVVGYIVDAVNKRFLTSICIKVRLVYIEPHCNEASDPYKGILGLDDASRSLSAFKDFWNENRSNVQRDVAHLFSGTELEDSFLSDTNGIAYLDTVCNRYHAYAINEFTDYEDTHFQTYLVAHELAHNAGAPHIGNVVGKDYIMEDNNMIRRGGRDGFRSDTKQTMTEYLRKQSCLSLEATPQSMDCAKQYGEKCEKDVECAEGLVCFPKLDVIGTPNNSFCGKPKKAGDKCQKDSDCMGYCQLLRCRSGVEGDLCKHNSDCQGDLRCIGTAGLAKCRNKRGAGDWCTADSDCDDNLYCQLLKCREGKDGDPCRSHGDCQNYSSKNYCRFARCYDGSKGDKCEYSSQCQSGLSCKCPHRRRWCIARRKKCD